MQPRQIYASTVTRRDRRWTSRRSRGRSGFGIGLLGIATLAAVLSVIAAVAAGLS